MSTGSERPLALRVAALIAAAALAGLFIHLGNWQAGKARLQDEARERLERARHAQPLAVGAAVLDATTVNGMPVAIEGEWDAAAQFYVDNRQEDGRPGVHVITPLRIQGGATRVLVNRGWVAWPDRSQPLPAATPASGRVRVTGTADVPLVKKPLGMAAEPREQAKLWFAPDLARFAQLHPEPLQPFVVLQSPHDAADALVRHWAPPEDRSATHRGYAYQWWGMAVVLLVATGVYALRRPR